MRTIGVVTTSRADYGIYRPLLRAIMADSECALRLLVAGMHLAPEFGMTVREIEQDGFAVEERIEMLVAGDSPVAIAMSMGVGVLGFAQSLGRCRPDLLVVLGDRFEMYAAALAALPFNVPVAHIHGGEVTRGVIDDSLRHSMTKLSHLHFVATQEYARRVRQLGEEVWRITVAGALSLDQLAGMTYSSRPELAASLGFELGDPIVLVTFHPETVHYERSVAQCQALLDALHEVPAQLIFTMPNADTEGRSLARLVRTFVAEHQQAHLVDNIGTQRYFSLMRIAAAMVGNSSSGLIEAPSFGLPVVNVGLRQSGRVRAANVIDAPTEPTRLLASIQQALEPSFRAQLHGMHNPYAAQAPASQTILGVVKGVPIDERLRVKSFCDMQGET